MNKYILLVLFAVLLSDCGKKGGYSSGGKRGFEAPPEGMVYVESGSFMMGSGDEDVVWAMNAMPKPKTVDDFWMDQTEVTNAAYRRFVYWAADSIARRALAEAGVDGFIIEDEDDIDSEGDDQPKLNYKTKIVSNKKNSAYEEQQQALRDNGYFYSKQESLNRGRQVDTRKLNYEYSWFDLAQAAQAKWDPTENRYIGSVRNMQGEQQEIVDRSSFIMPLAHASFRRKAIQKTVSVPFLSLTVGS